MEEEHSEEDGMYAGDGVYGEELDEYMMAPRAAPNKDPRKDSKRRDTKYASHAQSRHQHFVANSVQMPVVFSQYSSLLWSSHFLSAQYLDDKVALHARYAMPVRSSLDELRRFHLSSFCLPTTACFPKTLLCSTVIVISCPMLIVIRD